MSNHMLVEKQRAVLDRISDSQAKAELLSGGGEGAAFLTANPGMAQFRLPDKLMKIAIRRRLGIPVCQRTATDLCPLCGKTGTSIITPSGSHVFSCTEPGKGGAKGYRGTRHGMVAHKLVSALRQIAAKGAADIQLQKEPQLEGVVDWRAKQAIPPAKSRGDLLVTVVTSDTEVETRVLDLVVVHPNAGTDAACATTAGKAAEAAFKHKEAKYKRNWHFPADGFTPLAMETGGRMHGEFRSFLRWFLQKVIGGEGYETWGREEKAWYSRRLQFLITAVSVAVTHATSLAISHLRNGCKDAGNRRKPRRQAASAGAAVAAVGLAEAAGNAAGGGEVAAGEGGHGA